jgi:hypothetical protein
LDSSETSRFESWTLTVYTFDGASVTLRIGREIAGERIEGRA